MRKNYQMKPRERIPRATAKPSKVEKSEAEFRVWCESCCIRVAPNEEKAVVEGKSYHPGCYSKLMLRQATQVAGNGTEVSVGSAS
jgi:hypothetical protein